MSFVASTWERRPKLRGIRPVISRSWNIGYTRMKLRESSFNRVFLRWLLRGGGFVRVIFRSLVEHFFMFHD